MLLARENEGHAGAKRALDAFCLRARKYVGAYAAALGGLDGIAFGGGIGEHSAEIRARILKPLQWLGIDLDAEANRSCTGGGAKISAGSSRVAVFVVQVEEEPIIARAMVEVLAQQGA